MGSEELTQPMIKSAFQQEKPNEPILLGKEEAEISTPAGTRKCDVEVQLRFTPNERVEIKIPPEDTSLEHAFSKMFAIPSTENSIKLLRTGASVPIRFSSVGQGQSIAVPESEPMNVTLPTNEISSAVVHLFNFPDFSGESDYSITKPSGAFSSWHRCGCAKLAVDGWDITIAGNDKTGTRVKELEASGGWILTHQVRVSRKDGESFSSDELSNLIHCLYYFLSFALGRWAGVGLPVGYNKEGQKVWEQWGLRRNHRETGNYTWRWFDDRHSEALEQVFPGFYRLWSDPIWRKALTETIYWYVISNVAITDAGVVLNQSALELLAWTHCVLSQKMVSEKAFDGRGLTASDQFRLLLTSLKIPVEIPATLTALNGRPGAKWPDIPVALTTIRNSIVHPKEKLAAAGDALLEAWSLSAWCIEMILLRLCDFNGSYGNRLNRDRWVGQVDKVPWAQT